MGGVASGNGNGTSQQGQHLDNQYDDSANRERESLLSTELDGYCSELLLGNPKNYQVWYHRKWLLGELF